MLLTVAFKVEAYCRIRVSPLEHIRASRDTFNTIWWSCIRRISLTFSSRVKGPYVSAYFHVQPYGESHSTTILGATAKESCVNPLVNISMQFHIDVVQEIAATLGSSHARWVFLYLNCPSVSVSIRQQPHLRDQFHASCLPMVRCFQISLLVS